MTVQYPTDTIVAASPFHDGERRVQEKLGHRGIEKWARQMVRDYMPAQHRDFHTHLPFLVVAARDDAGRPWATILEGPDGFVTSPNPKQLIIDTQPTAGDALSGAFTAGADVGILGIEFATRRRNRVNGRIGTGGTGIVFDVDQTFGNCPQYIGERAWTRVEAPASGTPQTSDDLSASQQAWIADADTFFIASGYRGDGESATYGMDASHRGGERGFVEVLSATEIRFPDYAGNKHYNTIGNMLVDSRAGYLFVDFETGSLLQVTGTVDIQWDGDELRRHPGAKRLVTLTVDQVVELPHALSLRWEKDADSVRSLTLVDKIVESDDVTSFVFEARDRGALPSFDPGQHLSIELPIPGQPAMTARSYSLSGSPEDTRYRISVKREPMGLASRFLHDNVEPGAVIQGRRPSGDFTLAHDDAPVVLISAGVGITPMLSMLHALADPADTRRVVFVHGARDGAHHPLRDEVATLAAQRPGIDVHVAYSRPLVSDKAGRDYDSVGRVGGDLIASLIDDPNAHYYLCGPVAFMGGVQEDLQARGIPADRIHAETFGPAG